MDCKIIVIDLGSGSCKIGFAGEEHPRFTFPTIVGRLKKERRMSLGLVEHNTNQNKIFDGDECNAANLDINYPIINGTIDDWDGVKAILNYAFQHLGMSDEITHYPVIMTDSIYSKRDSRHKMAKLMFHTYHVPAFYIDYQPFFSLISNPGKNTGIIIEIGDGITQIFPCVGGYPMKKGMIKFPIGGSMITDYLMKNLNCPDLCTKNHLKDLSIIKKKCCRFAVDYDEERKKYKTNKIHAPKAFNPNWN